MAHRFDDDSYQQSGGSWRDSDSGSAAQSSPAPRRTTTPRRSRWEEPVDQPREEQPIVPGGGARSPGRSGWDQGTGWTPGTGGRSGGYRPPIHIRWDIILILAAVAIGIALIVVYRDAISAFLAQVLSWVITVVIIVVIVGLLLRSLFPPRRW